MHRINSGSLKLAVTAGMLLWASIAVTPAGAMPIPVTFNFNGVVSSIGTDAALAPTLFPTQTFSGFFTYNQAAPENGTTTGNSAFGRYDNAVTNLNINIGGLVMQLGTGGSNIVEITDGGADVFALTVPLAPNPPGTLVEGMYAPRFLEVFLVHGPSAFGNDDLPPTLGNLSATSGTFRMVFQNGLIEKQIAGTIAAVPLPPAVILFGAGLVALIGLGARNWQRAGNSVA